MKQPITGYRKDEEDHWIAELACGHFQHLRHNPPWTNRPWVESAHGREKMLNYSLECKKCNAHAPRDYL